MMFPLLLAFAAHLTLHADQPGPVIQRDVYGQFAEHLGHGIYGGIWVGPDSPIPNTRGIRNDVVAALRAIRIPVLRWPGGCFADEYHWQDGIGPREKRPSMINTHWGGVVETNAFGTHEFMDLVDQLGCEAYVCGNLGSGSVQEMMEWVEYMTSDAQSPMANLRRANGRDQPWRVKYFGVGNESWGCGGNMRPEFYADNYRRYNTFVKDYDRDHPIYRIASGASDYDYAWTETLMKMVGARMDGLSLHYYTLPTGDWKHKGSATQFGEDQYFSTLQRAEAMDTILAHHTAIMDRFAAPKKQVGLVVDEWGVWTDPEPGSNPGFLYQQDSLRNALAAALTFNIFHHYAGRIQMTNIAQMIDVLQAMILTDGPRMVLTPTYYVFDLYQVHQGATSLPVEIQSPDYAFGGGRIDAVSASASRDAGGRVHLSLVNTDPHQAIDVACAVQGGDFARVAGRVLTAPEVTSHNSFDHPDVVRPQAFGGAQLAGGQLTLQLPPHAIVVLELTR